MILESRQRKLADCSGPFYKTHTRRARNPANGSWRIVQVLSIKLILKEPGIPPTEVGGLFRSELFIVLTKVSWDE